MKTDIHPQYEICEVRCSCGNVFETRSTVSELRVERFQRRYSKAAKGAQQ